MKFKEMDNTEKIVAMVFIVLIICIGLVTTYSCNEIKKIDSELGQRKIKQDSLVQKHYTNYLRGNDSVSVNRSISSGDTLLREYKSMDTTKPIAINKTVKFEKDSLTITISSENINDSLRVNYTLIKNDSIHYRVDTVKIVDSTISKRVEIVEMTNDNWLYVAIVAVVGTVATVLALFLR